MSYPPDEKLRLMTGLQTSPDWEIICERIDKEVQAITSEISLNLKKRNYDKASHLNGKMEMAQFLKNLPNKIRRENQGIINRIKEDLASLRS